MSINTPAPNTKNQENIVSSSADINSEQNKYANILLVCSWIAIAIMVVTFILYVTGIFTPLVEPSAMPDYWTMNVHQFAQKTNAPSGWAWLNMLDHGDYLALIGLAFMGIVSVLGYCRLLIEYLRKKEMVYAAMVGIEIIVIVTAASGIIHVGG